MTVQSKRQKIKINLKIDKVYLMIDSAIPLALIVAELISNSYMHAFPEKSGSIEILIKRKDKNMIKFRYSDTGVGISPEIDLRKLDTCGMPILISVAENQLNGKIKIKSKNGFVFKMDFPDNLYSKRI
jgi:two-component sensor histidine kinase